MRCRGVVNGFRRLSSRTLERQNHAVRAARGPYPDLTISRLAKLPEAIEQLES